MTSLRSVSMIIGRLSLKTSRLGAASSTIRMILRWLWMSSLILVVQRHPLKTLRATRMLGAKVLAVMLITAVFLHRSYRPISIVYFCKINRAPCHHFKRVGPSSLTLRVCTTILSYTINCLHSTVLPNWVQVKLICLLATRWLHLLSLKILWLKAWPTFDLVFNRSHLLLSMKFSWKKRRITQANYKSMNAN